MEVIFSHGAGLNVHKKRITACRVILIRQASSPMGCWS
jgi:hypothetical protein